MLLISTYHFTLNQYNMLHQKGITTLYGTTNNFTQGYIHYGNSLHSYATLHNERTFPANGMKLFKMNVAI